MSISQDTNRTMCDVNHADLQRRGVVKGIGLMLEGGEAQSTNSKLTMEIWTNQIKQFSG